MAPPTVGVKAFKVVLVGDARAGKSCFLNRWNNGDFSDAYEPTISPELTTKDVIVDGSTVRLQVWDMGFGELDTTAQFPHYAGGAKGAVLMYDTSDSSSPDGVSHWHRQVCSLAGEDCVFVVAGCKADLKVPTGAAQRVRAVCQSMRAEHLETSARSGENVERTFESLARALVRSTSKPATPIGSFAGARSPGAPHPLSSGAPHPLSSGAALFTMRPEMPQSRTPQASNLSSATTPASLLDASSKSFSSTRPVHSSSGVSASASSTASVQPTAQPAAVGAKMGATAVPSGTSSKAVKLVLLGEPGVGKSAVAQRLGNANAVALEDEYMPTAGPEILTRRVTVKGETIRLQVWDAAGHDLMHEPKISAPVLQDVKAVVIMFDVTMRATFECINRWMDLLKAHAGPDVNVMLLGNKSDMHGRSVTIEEGKATGTRLQVPFIEFSAKNCTDRDVSELLNKLMEGRGPTLNTAAVVATPAESPTFRESMDSSVAPASTASTTANSTNGSFGSRWLQEKKLAAAAGSNGAVSTTASASEASAPQQSPPPHIGQNSRQAEDDDDLDNTRVVNPTSLLGRSGLIDARPAAALPRAGSPQRQTEHKLAAQARRPSPDPSQGGDQASSVRSQSPARALLPQEPQKSEPLPRRTAGQSSAPTASFGTAVSSSAGTSASSEVRSRLFQRRPAPEAEAQPSTGLGATAPAASASRTPFQKREEFLSTADKTPLAKIGAGSGALQASKSPSSQKAANAASAGASSDAASTKAPSNQFLLREGQIDAANPDTRKPADLSDSQRTLDVGPASDEANTPAARAAALRARLGLKPLVPGTSPSSGSAKFQAQTSQQQAGSMGESQSSNAQQQLQQPGSNAKASSLSNTQSMLEQFRSKHNQQAQAGMAGMQPPGQTLAGLARSPGSVGTMPGQGGLSTPGACGAGSSLLPPGACSAGTMPGAGSSLLPPGACGAGAGSGLMPQGGRGGALSGSVVANNQPPAMRSPMARAVGPGLAAGQSFGAQQPTGSGPGSACIPGPNAAGMPPRAPGVVVAGIGAQGMMRPPGATPGMMPIPPKPPGAAGMAFVAGAVRPPGIAGASYPAGARPGMPPTPGVAMPGGPMVRR